jgi:hypothetical protein
VSTLKIILCGSVADVCNNLMICSAFHDVFSGTGTFSLMKINPYALAGYSILSNLWHHTTGRADCSSPRESLSNA